MSDHRLEQIERSKTQPFTEISSFGKSLLGLSADKTLGGVRGSATVQKVSLTGTFLEWNSDMNYGRGGCLYRLPDPLGLFGGPTRASSPYLGDVDADLFEEPGVLDCELNENRLSVGLSSRGWPSEFSEAEEEFVEFNMTLPTEVDTELLAEYETWKGRYRSISCRSTDSMA